MFWAALDLLVTVLFWIEKLPCIQILPPSTFLEYFLILCFGGFFGVIFGFSYFLKMFLQLEWVTLGGLFSNFYSDFASFCLNHANACQV